MPEAVTASPPLSVRECGASLTAGHQAGFYRTFERGGWVVVVHASCVGTCRLQRGSARAPYDQRVERVSKEHILREIRRLAAEDGGRPVGVKRFATVTGIGQWAWMGRYWARWSDAVREAGLQPGEWNTQGHPDADLLRILAGLTREYGRIPTGAELQMRRSDHPEQPSGDTFRRRLGEKAVLHDKLLAFADAEPEFSDVAEILSSIPRATMRSRSKAADPDPIVTGVVYLIRMAEFYKIGKSNDPGRRQYELGLQLPEKHDVIHIIETDDPSGIEAYWHRRFAGQRTNGEWFRLSPEDVAAFTRRTYM